MVQVSGKDNYTNCIGINSLLPTYRETCLMYCDRLADCVQHIITSKCVKPIWMSVRGL